MSHIALVSRVEQYDDGRDSVNKIDGIITMEDIIEQIIDDDI